MTTKLLIDRELLERIDESAICDGTDATISDGLFTQLVAALDAPRQPEGDNSDFPNLRDGLEVVGWYHSHAEVATSEKARVVQWLPECVEPLCRLSDAQRAIDDLRDRLDVMTQCADNYSRMFEESAEECEHLKDCQENAMLHMTGLVSERDTLRQQRDQQAQRIGELEGLLEHAGQVSPSVNRRTSGPPLA